jgi:hypothetical protein
LSDYFSIARSASTTYSESTLLQLTGTGNLLIGTTTDATSLAGGLVINGSGTGAASSGTNTGALRVTGGVGVSGAGYFGSTVSAPTLTDGYITISAAQINRGSGNYVELQYAKNTAGEGVRIFGTTANAITFNQGTSTFAGSGAHTFGTTNTVTMTAGVLATTGAATFAGAVTIAGTVIHTLSATPASATAAGTVGTMSWDANYIYICTATNTWKRVAIATW